jgi:hypothetical protein
MFYKFRNDVVSLSSASWPGIVMYKKAVETQEFCAFAYEVSMGGYALCLRALGSEPFLEVEPDFSNLQSLETEMQAIAPLSEWSERLFDRLTA